MNMEHMQHKNKRWFLAGGGTGAGSFPLLCTVYFGKLAILFGCFLSLV